VLVAVVLLIGPIGWAALIFGTPVWVLGTALIVGGKPRARTRTVAAATA
jgi:ABC-type tungstate transport system substrate-binding protein